MTYSTIDSFYFSDKKLQKSPSGVKGVDEATETTLRIYGCELIQESGILLGLSQAVMTTGQVLFHRFYCKCSFTMYNVKIVAAACVWLASKLEECPIKARHVLIVFCRIECRREGLRIEHLDTSSKNYVDLKAYLIKTENDLLKAIGFVCHVEHPHKFISNYLAVLETPPELRQEAWNLANDSLRTTLCVRFKSEVVACGVVHAAARKFQIPLPENPPWWIVFDADKSKIDEVCRVLAHLYSRPKAQYVALCEKEASFTSSQLALKVRQGSGSSVSDSTPKTTSTAANWESRRAKDALIKIAYDKLESRKSNDHYKSINSKAEGPREESVSKAKTETSGERNKEKKREREDSQRVISKVKDRNRKSWERVKDLGHAEISKHGSSRDHRHYPPSCSYYSSREKEKDRRRHYSYA